MVVRYAAAICAAALALGMTAAQAGPCTEEIYQTDQALGHRLDVVAAKGKAGTESTFATTHHQPTPATIAGAEEKLGELSAADVAAVRGFMREALKADGANDTVACHKALADAQRVLTK